MKAALRPQSSPKVNQWYMNPMSTQPRVVNPGKGVRRRRHRGEEGGTRSKTWACAFGDLDLIHGRGFYRCTGIRREAHNYTFHRSIVLKYWPPYCVDPVRPFMSDSLQRQVSQWQYVSIGISLAVPPSTFSGLSYVWMWCSTDEASSNVAWF